MSVPSPPTFHYRRDTLPKTPGNPPEDARKWLAEPETAGSQAGSARTTGRALCLGDRLTDISTRRTNLVVVHVSRLKCSALRRTPSSPITSWMRVATAHASRYQLTPA